MNNVTVNESDVLVSVVSDEITVTITDAVGIPPGGTANQVLKKNSATDYDVSWASDVAGVPYTGATADVNLGEFGLLTGNIEFDTSPTNAPTGAGSMVWNDTEGTADLMLKGASVNLPIGQKQVIRAVNGTGGNLTRAAYRAVKITGAQGQRLQVSLARADSDANSKDTIGLVAEDISNNQEGFIVTSGTIANINTTGSLQGETWADGDTLYLSGTTSGVITNVKPSAPTHTVILGFVVYAHQNNGKIYVKVDNGYELDELHNVNAPTPTSGEYLRYNGTVWVDSTILAADLPTGIDAAKIGTGVVSNTEFGYLDGVTSAIQTQLNGKQATLTNPVTGTGVTGQVTYFTGTSAVTGSNNLFWDATNNRLGIGTISPAASLDVAGSINFGGSGNVTQTLQGNGTNTTFYNSKASLYINIDSDNNGSNDGIFFGRNRTGDSGGTTDLAIIEGKVSIGNINTTYNLDISGTLRNTTDAYFATSSGNVGVGATSAPWKLTVNGADMTVTNGGTNVSVTSSGGLGRIRSNTSLSFDYGSSLTEGITLKSDGLVGINNNLPSYRLDISGTLRNTTSAYFATSSGSVGIGTTSPAATLDVRGTAVFGANSFFQLIDTGGGNGRLVTTNIPAFDFGGTLLFRNFAGTTEYARIASTGNVSIGNTNNTYKLDISGTLRNTTDAYFATSSGNVGVGTTSPSILFQVSTRGGFDSSGQLFWGSSLTGNNRGILTYDTNKILVHSYGTTISFSIGSSFTDRAIVTSDSNFGLGQTSFGTSATKTLAVSSGTAPSTSPADAFQMYSADITAGNAAAHFRTEGGAVIKLYQQTTGVGSATRVGGGGTTLTDTDTFGGYTLRQIVQALQNAGFLQ